mmetsp:Transcript_34996/g.69080  ORF Transcript_34996/g.69080 Transcript_34996/m.69080 type:complete len:134 (-) Transcript_34996:284-685(-)
MDGGVENCLLRLEISHLGRSTRTKTYALRLTHTHPPTSPPSRPLAHTRREKEREMHTDTQVHEDSGVEGWREILGGWEKVSWPSSLSLCRSFSLSVLFFLTSHTGVEEKLEEKGGDFSPGLPIHFLSFNRICR